MRRNRSNQAPFWACRSTDAKDSEETWMPVKYMIDENRIKSMAGRTGSPLATIRRKITILLAPFHFPEGVSYNSLEPAVELKNKETFLFFA